MAAENRLILLWEEGLDHIGIIGIFSDESSCDAAIGRRLLETSGDPRSRDPDVDQIRRCELAIDEYVAEHLIERSNRVADRRWFYGDTRADDRWEPWQRV